MDKMTLAYLKMELVRIKHGVIPAQLIKEYEDVRDDLAAKIIAWNEDKVKATITY